MNGWIFSFFSLWVFFGSIPAKAVENYVYFNLERSRIHDELFLNTPELVGAQLKYTWNELEPTKDHYDFRSIQSDFNFLQSRGKKLFVQIQDVSFSMTNRHVPDYLVYELEYHGGVAIHYLGEGPNAKPEGFTYAGYRDAVIENLKAMKNAFAKQQLFSTPISCRVNGFLKMMGII